jgi:alkylhydroperoxidase family enzyme
VKVLTLEPAKVTDQHSERMRAAGWTDEQIFEASFVTALFAFFNRMAEAYGLDYAAGSFTSPEMKERMEKK